MQTKLHEQSHIGITLRKTTWCSNHTLYPVLYRTHWAEFHALFGSVNTDYLEFKGMLGNLRIFFTAFSLKGLRHLLNIGCTTYLGQNGSGIVLNMHQLEVLFIAMV